MMLSGSRLRVTSQRTRNGRVVRAEGDVDLATAPLLRRHLSDSLAREQPRPPVVVVDLHRVDFLGVAGLAVLAAADERARARRIRLEVVASTHAVSRALTVSGLRPRLLQAS